MTGSSKPTVLVTGGAGYIGSHCCQALAAAGMLPIAYDNLSSGHRDFVKWGPLIEGDIRNRAALSAALALVKPIAVMHLAALALVGESMTEPAKYWDVNVGGTLALVESMRLLQLTKLVFSSSCAVYGEPKSVPIDEDAPKQPVNPYGASKLAAERIMDDFGKAYGLKSLRLRYFNAAGSDPNGEIGEDHRPETHLIPLVLAAAVHRKPVWVFGDDYPTPDGTPIRDYVHVVDIASAHLKALDYLLLGGESAGINLGTGEGISVAQVIAIVEEVIEHDVPMTVGQRRSGDPSCLVANPQRAMQRLGWRPQRSQLRSIIADAWGWHQKRFGGQVSLEALSARVATKIGADVAKTDA